MPNKILIVGTCFTDSKAVVTQAQLLYKALEHTGYPVSIVSKHRGFLKRIVETLGAVLSTNKKDIILLQVYGTKSIYLECATVVLSHLKGTKIISTLHGGLIPDFYHQNRVKKFLLKIIFELSSAITVPSSFIKHQLPEMKKPLTVIRNMMPLDIHPVTSAPSSKTVSIFWMRAFHEVYNPAKALDILVALKARGIQAQMVMAGPDMGLYEEIKNRIEKEKLPVELHQKLSQQEINQIASGCDVYLCTNTADNAPVTFIEMMARGIPVVSTNVGGIPFMVDHNKNVLLSQTNEAEDLANLIITLNKDETLRKSLVTNGLKLAEEYTTAKVIEKWSLLLNTYNITPLLLE